MHHTARIAHLRTAVNILATKVVLGHHQGRSGLILANPMKTVGNLLQAQATANAERLLTPAEVTSGLDAVDTLLRSGLPDKDDLFEDPARTGAIRALSDFYASAAASGGESDRLFRADLSRLSEGLADVADRMVLAAMVRSARKAGGFSIRELARFSGVDHSYISRVERGAVPKPSKAVLRRLEGPLGVTGWPADGAGGYAEERPGGLEAGIGGDYAATDEQPALAELGLHRPQVRALLKVARELPDEHLELLAAQAKTMREQVKRKRG